MLCTGQTLWVACIRRVLNECLRRKIGLCRLKNGEVISVRLRKNDWRLVIVGAILPLTIIAAPRHGKPWQALVGARLVTDKMVLLAGGVDKESAV